MKRYVLGGILAVMLALVVVSCAPQGPAVFKQESKAGREFFIGPEWREFKGFGVIDLKKYPEKSRAILMAMEAARLDAIRKAVEYFYGLKIEGGSTVKDFVAENVEMKSRFEGFLRNIAVKDSGVDEKNGVVWVVIRVYKQDVEKILGKKLLEFPEVKE